MSAASPENVLRLRGPLTIANAETLHGELSSALRSGGEIVVEVEPEAEVDLTFLQLLIAAQRSAAVNGRRISLQSPPTEALAGALASCGFTPVAGATALADIFSH